MTSPQFSVIVPAFALPHEITAFLEAMLPVHSPEGGFEIIIADDASPAPFDEIVRSYRDRLDVTLVRNAHGGPGAARNAGAKIARGEYLAFIDCDCQLSPDWLLAMQGRLAQSPGDLLGGRRVNVQTDAYSLANQLIGDAVHDYYNADAADARFCASNNIVMSAATFRELGGFDAAHFPFSAEDRDFCDRWRHAGHNIQYLRDVTVYHTHTLTLGAFCRQHFEYGRGAWRFHAARKTRLSGEFREGFDFHTNLPELLRNKFAQMSLGLTLRVLALMLVWQVANAVGFFWQAPRGD